MYALNSTYFIFGFLAQGLSAGASEIESQQAWNAAARSDESCLDMLDQSASYHSDAGVLRYVNPLIGTRGYVADSNGGMIPSVAPPFAMTRWTAQTRENFISQCPYHDADEYIHGFQATHQPAIWMGESGHVVLSPGLGDVKPRFEQRGMKFSKTNERSTPYVYEVILDADSIGDQGWNLTEEAVNGGPVPGGAGGVPDFVSEGANGRVRRADPDEHQITSMDDIINRSPEERIMARSTCSKHRAIKVYLSHFISSSGHIYL